MAYPIFLIKDFIGYGLMANRRIKNQAHIEFTDNGCRLRLTYKGVRYSKSYHRNYRTAEIHKDKVNLLIQANEFNPDEFFNTGIDENITNLTELAELIYKDKERKLKPQSFNKWQDRFNYLNECPYKDLRKPRLIYNWLDKRIKGRDTLKRTLQALSTYASKHCEKDYFKGMANDVIVKSNYKPRPFTNFEKEILLSNLSIDTYKLESLFIRFMLLTGCRPSEAVGFTYGQIKERHLLFDRSITEQEGKLYHNDETKTKRDRLFPLYNELNELLNEIYLRANEGILSTNTPENLVFSVNGKNPIRMSNFRHRVWNRVAPEDSSPYNCRDTFITEQLMKGVSATIIANWCGNSTEIIEKHYMGRAMLSNIIPL
jgi:integrase